jgi:hypothetical protein
MHEPYIAVLPYGQHVGSHLAHIPLTELYWPLGTPETLSGTARGAA